MGCLEPARAQPQPGNSDLKIGGAGGNTLESIMLWMVEIECQFA